MFARSQVRRGLSPYAVFLSRYKNHPQLKNVKSVVKRGKIAGKLYRALSPVEMRVIRAIAVRSTYVRKPKAPRKSYTGLSAWTKYVKQNISTIPGPSRKRMSVLAKAFRALKKKQSSKA
mmetsp:Transcript_28048/g.32473  ORF Transcript_28048/g.32473 Transcript_28048/m.32473 type:complete len:119 (+) Transcript_28048:44-400(+)